MYRSTYINSRLWCECTCRFLCRPLAVGPSCKGQSVWEGTASLPVGQPEGHHSSWRSLRSESHLKFNPNFTTHFSLHLVIYSRGLLVSASRLLSKFTAALLEDEMLTDVEWMSSGPSLDWLPLRRPASMCSLAPSVGWDSCFCGRGRPSNALPTKSGDDGSVKIFIIAYKRFSFK